MELCFNLCFFLFILLYSKKWKEKLKNYKTLKTLLISILSLSEGFPACYSNNNLCEDVSSVLFSLRNERNAIIVGEDKRGITQVAKWCAECVNNIINKEQNLDTKQNNNYLCLCTKNLSCLDLIGPTKPYTKSDNVKSNEILKFIFDSCSSNKILKN